MSRNAPPLDQLARSVARAAYASIPGKQVVFEQLRGRLPESLFQHLHFHGEIVVPIGAGNSVRMYHYGHKIENRLFWRGIDAGFEPTTVAIWRTLAPHARGVLDIGANTGVFALLARALSAQASVVAVEPVARIFEKLVTNVALNDMDIICLCEAVSDTIGVGSFLDPGTEHLYTVTIEQGPVSTATPAARGHRRTVALTTVDGMVERLGLAHVDLIKLDVESHEPAALRGARRTLERLRPSLIVEIWNDAIGQAVDQVIRPLGYEGYSIDEQACSLSLRAQTTVARTTNFLFVPSEKRSELEARIRSEAPIAVAIAG
jgi:FkbM family methyltransferase